MKVILPKQYEHDVNVAEEQNKWQHFLVYMLKLKQFCKIFMKVLLISTCPLNMCFYKILSQNYHQKHHLNTSADLYLQVLCVQ